MRREAESDLQRLVLLPLKMEERGKPRDAGTSRSWKRQEMTFLATQIVKNLPAMQKTQVQSLGQKISWKREWQPTSVFLPGESHGHGVAKSRRRLND